MKTIIFLIFCVNFFLINNLLAQTNFKFNKISVELKQSLIYMGVINSYIRNSYKYNNDEIIHFGRSSLVSYTSNNFIYSPGICIEYCFLKKHLAIFTGLEYSRIKSTRVYHKLVSTHAPVSGYIFPPLKIVTENSIKNLLEVPMGLKVYFIKDQDILQPYLSIGSLLRFASSNSEISVSNEPSTKSTTKLRYINLHDYTNGFYYLLLSIGSEIKLKNNLLLNFELNTKHNRLLEKNYSLTSTIGLKYDF